MCLRTDDMEIEQAQQETAAGGSRARKTCPACGGAGRRRYRPLGSPEVICPNCGGSRVDCRMCGGAGTVYPCVVCGGEGTVEAGR